jgi:hypothetical protein
MLTIGNTLRVEIERYARSVTQSGTLMLAAKNGKLSRAHVGRYAGGLLFLIRGTLAVLERAQQRALAMGDLHLAAHYRRKLLEERGHDRWAEKDLEKLPSTLAYGPDASGSALGRLVNYLGEVANQDPCLYLSYILLAEYLTVLAGPEWLEILEHNCGVPRTTLTVVDNHIALDRDHVAEGVQTIDMLVTSPEKRAPMLDVLRRSIGYYEEFWLEILSTTHQAA